MKRFVVAIALIFLIIQPALALSTEVQPTLNSSTSSETLSKSEEKTSEDIKALEQLEEDINEEKEKLEQNVKDSAKEAIVEITRTATVILRSLFRGLYFFYKI